MVDLVVDPLDDCYIAWAIGDYNGLRFVGRLYVPDVDTLRKRVRNDAYRSRLLIHYRGNKMYRDMKRYF